MGLQKVRHEGRLKVWSVAPFSADQSEGPSTTGEAVQGRVLNPLQLRQELHRRDQNTVGDQAREHQEACRKGALEKSACSSGACMEGSPHHQVGGNHSG